MPRDIPVGNGTMLVTFDGLYRIRDFYYPHIGQENHAGHRPFHFGVWVEDTLSWVHDTGWSRSLRYEPDTLVTNVQLTNETLALELICGDAVDFHVNVYLRQIKVRDLSGRDRVIKLYFHHDFNILGNDVGDTAYFDPATRSLIHYKASRYFLANCCGPDACGINSFATGLKNRPDLEGTFRDAEDGQLGRNPIAQGSVDSTIEIEVRLPSSDQKIVHYWIIAGQRYAEVLELDRFVLDRSPGKFIDRTRSYWRGWLNKEEWDLRELPEPVGRLFKTSLLVIRTQVDDHGPVLAANDTDYLHFSRDTYSYCWPRDGALVVHALDLAGFGELSQKFFRFCADVVRPEGYLMHKYNPDGTVASSWHPWVNDAGALPIQEDESALVLWALWHHYDQFRDVEFIRDLYRPLVIQIGNFLSDYRDPKTKLPLPSWDLWEERCGVHAFTCGAVYAGIKAAMDFAKLFGQQEKVDWYRGVLDELRAAMDEHLFDTKRNRFVRSLIPSKGNLEPDHTLDASIKGLWHFGAYPMDDPRVLATVTQLRQGLIVKTPVGGVARYEKDLYFQVSKDDERIPGNPWFICTLWDALHRIRLSESREQMASEVMPTLEWVARHALPSGILAEQLHPETGEPLSVSPLTWSHAVFVECVIAYLARLADLRRCPTCNLSTFLYSRHQRR
ncbi:MAG: glycoside hydrolase family 15 protein [Phycisphaerae bacterium]|nr:glycoside hydrolase family 15 protein [Phycisphaerae bacterium]